MCGGQAIDLASVGRHLDRTELEFMHQLKTGALLTASIMLGALCGKLINEYEKVILQRYASAIGLAFQVVDDILDATADSTTLGKTAGKDAANDKPTYVSMLGLDASKQLAQHLRKQAHDALHELAALPNATAAHLNHHPIRTQRLAELADFIVQRSA